MHFDRKCLCLPKSEAEGGEAERWRAKKENESWRESSKDNE